ncbi:hypothetical protein M885DRAFT_565140 [Pelagophyceae sp. CCMP2097]|nr:hypothetical protein M885DRAFT_565140 [Pelagophyceae sp. CCMP2097]
MRAAQGGYDAAEAAVSWRCRRASGLVWLALGSWKPSSNGRVLVEGPHSVERRILILNCLRDAFEVNRSTIYSATGVIAGAAVLGRLAAAAAQKPEFDLLETRYLLAACDWLGDARYEVRRYAAAVVL